MNPPALHRLVALGFAGLLCSVGLIQGIVELGRGEKLQALDLFRAEPSAARLRAYEQDLESTSWVAQRLRPWMQYVQFRLLRNAGDRALIGRGGWLFYRPGVEYFTQRPRPTGTGSSPADVVAAIDDFRDQLAERGIPLLVVPAPNKESIYPERLTTRATPSRPSPEGDTRAVIQLLRAAGVEVVDLFGAFADRKAASPPAEAGLYLKQDSHWSPAGAELAARTVAGHLLSRGWIQAGAADYALKPVVVHRVGDILRMLQVPALERAAVRETIECRQVLVAGTEAPYRDTPNAEVLVLGDSFLRIYEQDEPGAAGFIAHLARELKQPVLSVVNDGGASTLVRQELIRRPGLLANKRLLIWEFVERDIRLGTEGWQKLPLPPHAAPSVTGNPY